MSATKRIYIAGKLNGMACDYIKNVHRMIVWGDKIRRLGYAVFIPGIDFLAGCVIGNWDYNAYFDNSQPWLDVCDAVFLVPGWEDSEGTKREIMRAEQKKIPIFASMIALDSYFKEKEK